MAISDSVSAEALRPGKKLKSDDNGPTTVMTQLLSNSSSFPPIGRNSTWKVGWKTPFLICAFYITAFALAISHFVFASQLNGRAVPLDGFLRQSYVSAISIAFALSFRSMLTASLSAAFIQRLWTLFRYKPMKASTIDSLLSLLQTPLKLLHFDVFWNARLEWVFALCCLCIPIATVFPPGSLTVELKEKHSPANMIVPTFIPVSSLDDNLAFHIPFGLPYVTPRQELVRAAERSIMSGSYLNGPSPCGQNCTYALAFQGPDFQCSNNTYQDLELEDISYDYSVQGGDYRAAGALIQENFDFEVHYYQEVDLAHEFDPELVLSCFLRKSDYYVNVTYIDGTPIFDLTVNNSQYLNSTTLLRPGTLSNSTDPQPGVPDSNNTAAIANLNVWAIYDSLVQAMSGDVGRYGEYDQIVNDTIVLESSLVQYTFADNEEGLIFNISEASLNSMLHNITLSTLSLGFWNSSADVISGEFVNTYSFSGPRRYSLVVPYAACLAVSLILVGIGLWSLFENSVAASNGFLQTIQTSRGSVALDLAARGSSLGGPDNVPNELEDLKLIFGELKEQDGKSEIVRRAGWGTRNEVEPLVKGEYYDG